MRVSFDIPPLPTIIGFLSLSPSNLAGEACRDRRAVKTCWQAATQVAVLFLPLLPGPLQRRSAVHARPAGNAQLARLGLRSIHRAPAGFRRRRVADAVAQRPEPSLRGAPVRRWA